MTEVIRLLQKDNGYCQFLLRSEEVYVIISNMGCQIRSIFTKDKNGCFGDIVLGAEAGEDPAADGAYMGSIVGRVANRIAGDSFELNGRTYKIAVTNGPNHLHGGVVGFDQKLFDWNIIENGIELSCVSEDMEEGYPGRLELKTTYKLEGNFFSIRYDAVSDADTILNITNHTYFKLNTEEKDKGVLGHRLYLNADSFMPADKYCLVTGEKRAVENTCFDFRNSPVIADMLDETEEQVIFANGYDHAFVLNSHEDAIKLSDPSSGRTVTISTTEPMVHVYTGNYLAGGAVGKTGSHYPDKYGIALETEKCPDSIHLEKEPTVILRKGENWSSETNYKFKVEL